jgi:hypothetical protein
MSPLEKFDLIIVIPLALATVFFVAAAVLWQILIMQVNEASKDQESPLGGSALKMMRVMDRHRLLFPESRLRTVLHVVTGIGILCFSITWIKLFSGIQLRRDNAPPRGRSSVEFQLSSVGATRLPFKSSYRASA